MTRFTYFSSYDGTPTPVPPKYYYSYEEGSAGRLTSAAPAEPPHCHQHHCHCHCHDEPPKPPSPPRCVCYSTPSAPAAPPPTGYICYPSTVKTPNVPAYCLPAFSSKKAEDDPVIHLPHNVAYSYPAQPQPQPEAQYQYPSYMCYPVSSSESPAPNAVAWQGSSKDEVDMQNRAIHYEQQQKVQLVPYQEAPNSEHQYWCKELDGNYTLRTIKEIGDDCKIGHWQLSKDNYWYWVRDPQD